MGGSSGDTNITNTGLGDEQFKTVTENQANIATSIDDGRADATGRFDTVDTGLSNIRGDISGVGTNLSSGFTNLQDLLGQNMEANRQGFTGVNTNINQATGQIQSGMDAGFTGVTQNLADGFGTMDERFNRVDTAQQTAQTAIDTGFQDQTNAFSDLDTRLTDDFNTANQNMTGGFAEVGQNLSDLDTNTQNRLDTVQGNVLTGQAILDQNLGQVANAQDIYYGDLSGRQTEIQQGQDQFQSNFDDYVQRYSEDTTLANQTRADLQTGLTNATQNLRTDIGNFAQAAATGNAALSTQMSDSDRASRDALGNLNTAVQGGFTGQAMSAQQAQQNLVTRLGNLGSMVDTVGSTLDTNTQRRYASLMSSFDDNGNLIRSSIDDQGNTIQRSMDDQGNLILSQFDQAGNQIGQVDLNVNEMLTQAEQYQRNLSGQISGVQDAAGRSFDEVQRAIGGGFSDANQRASQFFDAQRGAISDQGTQIMSRIGSQIGNLDAASQKQFQDLSQSFDENGNLINQSVDNVGNVISRQIDTNGNLTLRTLDTTGRLISQNNYNVTGLLNDLGTRSGALQQTQTSLADRIDQGFANVSDFQRDGFSNLTQGQEVIRQQSERGFSDANQGLMAAQRDNMSQFQRMSADIMGGFDAANGVMDTQTRDIARVAAQQGNLNDSMRQQFSQIGQAFDDSGRLIQNSIMNNGNIISRNIDDNGNLLLRAFDTTGRTIGNQVVNINRALMDLGQLDFYAGANVSMGNLSPAMTGAVPTGGFANPFTVTR
jgi:hypothetical protein